MTDSVRYNKVCAKCEMDCKQPPGVFVVGCRRYKAKVTDEVECEHTPRTRQKAP